MAVYHLKVSIGSRAGGQSAGAKADYIEREGNYEKDREELEHKEHGNMPEWAKDDPHSYWEAADEHERANGRLYREIQFALPKELNEEQRRELASSFAASVTEGERLPYTLAIHRGGPNGENPHAHLMFSERPNDGIERGKEQWFKRYNAKAPEKGGTQKSRAAMPQAWLEDTRKAWAAGGKCGAGAGGARGAHRPPKPSRAARRGGAIRRPPASGRVEPRAKRPSWTGAIQSDAGRGIGDGPTGGASGSGKRGGSWRAGHRQPPSGAAGARDRRYRGAAEGDL